ncbi:MAG: hypothetical protein LBH51_06030 [Treponema sp.]|jgi:hypothetical protein|nr:hypothetical protein [Treponema sp.]
MNARGLGCLLLLALGLCPLPGQGAPGNFPRGRDIANSESLIGLTLEEVYALFGAPREMYALRGREAWQDDVVLVYSQGDFYVLRDRVWQVGVPAIRGIRLGDSREAVVLALGEDAEEGADYFILSLGGYAWPLALRVNLDNSARVSALFVYRSDF